MADSITILVNGETRAIPGRQSVRELLASLDLDERTVVVELNREIIRRPRLGETILTDGDSLELVHFVGGG